MQDARGAVYPDDVLQEIARELTILHTLNISPVADELDPRLSFDLWCEVEHFVLYIIESAVRASERLHPSSRSRLAHLLIEEWIASRKSSPNPSSGIVSRTIVSLVIKTGLNTKLFRDGYGKFRTACDGFLNSPYRKTTMKDYDDLSVLTLLFINRIRDGRTQEGQPIRFGGTGAEIENVRAHVIDCFARAAQCIQNLSY